MMSVTTKPEFSQPAIETSCGLFDWFDPIELGIRDRVLKRGKTPLLTTDQARGHAIRPDRRGTGYGERRDLARPAASRPRAGNKRRWLRR